MQIAAVLDDLEIPYVLGGSLASSLVGEPRSTADVDVAISVGEAGLAALLEAVRDEFYVSAEAAADAMRDRGAFNIIHLASMQKVDLFILGDDLLDRRQIEHRRRVSVGEVELWVGSVEDQILRKLSWYRLGSEVSERQWRDVVAMLAVQGDRVDLADLKSAAASVGVADLVERALADAERWKDA